MIVWPRWSRSRGVTAVFATVAVVCLAAAYVGPAGMMMVEAQAEDAPSTSLYASTVHDSQSFVSAPDEAGTAALGFERDSYVVYVTPTPTPTPTPEPTQDGSSSSFGGGAPPPVYYTGGGSSAEWLLAAGIAESDWGYVDYIVSRESGWNPNATNSSSGACGLVQAYPCSKVPGSGYNPVDNLSWANGYAVGRYGSWAGAYSFWTSNHWW